MNTEEAKIVKIEQEPFIKVDKSVHLTNYVAEDADLEITIPFPTFEVLIATNDSSGYDAFYYLEQIFKKIGKRKGFLEMRTDVVSHLEGIIDDHENLCQSNEWSEIVEDYEKDLRERLDLTEENQYESEEFESELEDFLNFSSEKPFLNGVCGGFRLAKDVVLINDYRLDVKDILARLPNATFIEMVGLIFSKDCLYYNSYEFQNELNRSFHNFGFEKVKPLVEAKFKEWHSDYSINFDKGIKPTHEFNFILVDGKTINLERE